jgi:hypothetical protein
VLNIYIQNPLSDKDVEEGLKKAQRKFTIRSVDRLRTFRYFQTFSVVVRRKRNPFFFFFFKKKKYFGNKQHHKKRWELREKTNQLKQENNGEKGKN